MYTILVRREHADEFVRRKEFAETDLFNCSVYCKASSFDEAKRYCEILKEKAKRNNVNIFIIPLPPCYSEGKIYQNIPNARSTDNGMIILVTFYSYFLSLEDILYTASQIEHRETLYLMTRPLGEYKNKLVMRDNDEILGTIVFTDEESTFQFIEDKLMRKTLIRLRDLLVKESIVLDAHEFKLHHDGPVDMYYLVLYTDKDSTEAKNICLKYLKGGINDE